MVGISLLILWVTTSRSLAVGYESLVRPSNQVEESTREKDKKFVHDIIAKPEQMVNIF
jgi:hypothetical protein